MSVNIESAAEVVCKRIKGLGDLYIGKDCDEADRTIGPIIKEALKPFRGAGYDYVADDNGKVELIVILEDDNLDNATII